MGPHVWGPYISLLGPYMESKREYLEPSTAAFHITSCCTIEITAQPIGPAKHEVTCVQGGQPNCILPTF